MGSPSLHDESPKKWGAYLIGELLGSGAMRDVYLGTHEQLGKEVAVKVLRNPAGDAELRERFVREGIAASRIRHPNVVEVLDAGESSAVRDDVNFVLESGYGRLAEFRSRRLEPLAEPDRRGQRDRPPRRRNQLRSVRIDRWQRGFANSPALPSFRARPHLPSGVGLLSPVPPHRPRNRGSRPGPGLGGTLRPLGGLAACARRFVQGAGALVRHVDVLRVDAGELGAEDEITLAGEGFDGRMPPGFPLRHGLLLAARA